MPPQEAMLLDRREFGASLLGLTGLAAALQARAAGATAGAGEANLVVMPLLDSQEVFLVPPPRPHCFVRHLSLEGFAARNWRAVPGAAQGVWRTNHTWEWREDGSFGCIGRVTQGVRFTLAMRPAPDALDVRVTVTNFAGGVVEELYGGMCVEVRRNVLMHDPTLARTYVSAGGRVVPVRETDIRRSPGGPMPVFFPRGTPAGRRWIPEALPPYGWRVSPTELDSPLAAVVSKDGTWVVGTWFWPCRHVAANAKIPYHGCIHSEPAFGTVAPGTSATAVGRLYIARGGLPEVWARMDADWRRARQSHPAAG